MVKKKSAYGLTAMFLAISMLSLMMLAVAAQTDNQASGVGSWQPPKDFVDPVTLKIQEFRAQGLTDDEITVELEKLGMGWYPKTGATWLGRSLTPEEQANLPISIPVKDTSAENMDSIQDGVASFVSKASSMRTGGYSWDGVSAEMVCGSMSVASGQTQKHYACIQLGDLNGITNWAEIVVTHNLGEAYKWYTYDSDESGGTMEFYMNKNTPSTATDTYIIMLDGTQDGNGWKYDMWINYNWVRSGHLSNRWVQAGFQKEVFSNGQFTNDASSTLFNRNWLHNSGGWLYWTNNVNTGWTAAYPVRESHQMGPYSYIWNTWVQN
jgi:hypothetical protein